MLTKRIKTKIVEEHKKSERDTGSASIQIALHSRQIDELIKHLKKHPKDNHSRRGLLRLVGQRRKLLAYLKRKDTKTYEGIIKKLGLKK